MQQVFLCNDIYYPYFDLYIQIYILAYLKGLDLQAKKYCSMVVQNHNFHLCSELV